MMRLLKSMLVGVGVVFFFGTITQLQSIVSRQSIDDENDLSLNDIRISTLGSAQSNPLRI